MNLSELKEVFQGEIHDDNLYRSIYSTDASIFNITPQFIAYPKSIYDIKHLIYFAKKNNTYLIPRTAGTSLAGQVVGDGIIVDVSKHFTQIVELNLQENWVKVQPGVVLDELNLYLREHGLMFGPETSTANRCMVGGMVGNNACGLHSLKYGSTRDHLLEVEAILSDGHEVTFKEIAKDEFEQKQQLNSLEGKLYREIFKCLSDKNNQNSIIENYPAPDVKRRNTGYALDLLLHNQVFNVNTDEKFNFSKLIAGSEGTLCFITAVTLNLVEIFPKHKALLCVHLNSVEEAIQANLSALEFNPSAIELMDKEILDCTKDNITQNRNRFFINGNPGAILIVEFNAHDRVKIETTIAELILNLQENRLGLHYPVVWDGDTKNVWDLRKAGLGVLSNIKGDEKAISFIEDTAVHPTNLLEYISDIKKVFNNYGVTCVYHAHIATGELHLRPKVDLKTEKGKKLMFSLGQEVALLVKKYKGSLSGEHGDGIVRSPFVKDVLGKYNYKLLQEVKNTWDPLGIFNRGKIILEAYPKESYRTDYKVQTPKFVNLFNYYNEGGFQAALEKCNGSGDCRKSSLIGGIMCPSYMATKDELSTTRGRANALRNYILQKETEYRINDNDVYSILKLCLSCKGCKSECPSSVDMAKLKAEFLNYYYKTHRIGKTDWIFGNYTSILKYAKPFSKFYNAIAKTKIIDKTIKSILNIAPERQLPVISSIQLRHLQQELNSPEDIKGNVLLFIDEFTYLNDTHIALSTIQLLFKLGFKVDILPFYESGRSFISKGLLKKAKSIAELNIQKLMPLVGDDDFIVGIEPSATLSFVDEYIDLVSSEFKNDAERIAEKVFLIDEFISKQKELGNIKSNNFLSTKANIILHGHCHQKSIRTTKSLVDSLQIPENFKVEEVKSGCCGMAGSFGFSKENYKLSQKIGELVLFPFIRKLTDEIIVAPGTSCRQQIMEATGKKVFHPVEVLLTNIKE